MKNINKPKINEYWNVKYGKNIETLKIIKNKELQCPNWRVHSFNCENKKGENIEVKGTCFIDRVYLQ